MPEACQYIVVHKGLNMPPGKLAAQAAHASLGVMLERKHTILANDDVHDLPPGFQFVDNEGLFKHRSVRLLDTKEARSWFEGRFVKLVVYVKSEQKLLNLSKKLDDLEITNKLIYDAGRTVFNGKTTLTCMGVEPIYRDNIPKCLKVLRLLD